MIILIIWNQTEIRTKYVRANEIQSRISAGGAHATEAEVLRAFMDSPATEPPLKQITDSDGDIWKLTKQWSNDRGDFFTYELQ